MIRYFILSILISVSCFVLEAQEGQSIQDYIKAQKLEADEIDEVFYAIDSEGKGAFPKRGDYVMVNFKGKLLDGTIFDESEEGQPFVFQLGYRQVIKGWERGMSLFKVGDKGQLILPADLAYGKAGAGNRVPANAPVVFEIELLKILNETQYDEYMVELERKERDAFLQKRKNQVAKDKKDIHYYCAENKIKAKALPSGLSYSITKKGKGANAKEGDILTVAYEGYLVNGEQFDASKRKKPLTFPLGKRKVIQGWEKGLKQFNKGSEGWLIIPSELAYGPRGIKEDNINIPENSILIFKIKVKDIK